MSQYIFIYAHTYIHFYMHINTLIVVNPPGNDGLTRDSSSPTINFDKSLSRDHDPSAHHVYSIQQLHLTAYDTGSTSDSTTKVYMYIHIYIYLYMCMYIHIYVYIYIYIY
jgi:hypothetical protein